MTQKLEISELYGIDHVLLKNLEENFSTSYSNLMQLTKQGLLNDSKIQDAVYNNLRRQAENELRSKRDLKQIVVHDRLTPEERSRLEVNFSEFSLVFKPSQVTSGHPYSRVSRILQFMRMLKWCNYNPTAKPPPGYDVLIKDSGGSALMTVNQELIGIHCDRPIIGGNCMDALRHANTKINLEAIRNNYPNTIRGKLANAFLCNDKRVTCYHRSEDCTVRAEHMIFVHSTYDRTPRQIAEAMHSANCRRAFGCLLYDPRILHADEGSIKHQNAKWKKGVRKTLDGDIIYIDFHFTGDAQNGYRHKLTDYLSIVRGFSEIYRDHQYVFAHKLFQDGILYFEVLKTEIRISRANTVFRCFPESSVDKFTVLYGYQWQLETRADYSWLQGTNVNHMHPVRYVVPTDTFKRIYTYAFTLPNGRFTFENLLIAAKALNNRVIINGTSVLTRKDEDDKIDELLLPNVVSLIYVLVYAQRYNITQTIKNLIDDQNDQRAYIDSITRKFTRLALFLSRKKRRSDKHEKDIMNEMKLSFDEKPTEHWIAKFFPFGQVAESLKQAWKELKTPKTHYKIFSEVMPEVITLEEELNGFILDNSFSDDRYDVVLQEDMLVKKIREAIANNLPPIVVERVIVDIDHRHNCEEKLEERKVEGDGSCLFHALKVAGDLNLTIKEIKKRLFHSDAFENLNELEKEIQTKILDDSLQVYDAAEKWGDTGTIDLFVKEFGMGVCLHIKNSGCELRGSRLANRIHILFSNEHFDALVPKEEVLPLKVYRKVDTHTTGVYADDDELDFTMDLIEKEIDKAAKFLPVSQSSQVEEWILKSFPLGGYRVAGYSILYGSISEIIKATQLNELLGDMKCFVDFDGAPGDFADVMKNHSHAAGYGYSRSEENYRSDITQVVAMIDDNLVGQERISIQYSSVVKKIGERTADIVYINCGKVCKSKKNINKFVWRDEEDVLISKLNAATLLLKKNSGIAVVNCPIEYNENVIIFLSNFTKVEMLVSNLTLPLMRQAFFVCYNFRDETSINLDVLKKEYGKFESACFECEVQNLYNIVNVKTRKINLVDNALCERYRHILKPKTIAESVRGGKIKTQTVVARFSKTLQWIKENLKTAPEPIEIEQPLIETHVPETSEITVPTTEEVDSINCEQLELDCLLNGRPAKILNGFPDHYNDGTFDSCFCVVHRKTDVVPYSSVWFRYNRDSNKTFIKYYNYQERRFNFVIIDNIINVPQNINIAERYKRVYNYMNKVKPYPNISESLTGLKLLIYLEEFCFGEQEYHVGMADMTIEMPNRRILYVDKIIGDDQETEKKVDIEDKTECDSITSNDETEHQPTAVKANDFKNCFEEYKELMIFRNASALQQHRTNYEELVLRTGSDKCLRATVGGCFLVDGAGRIVEKLIPTVSGVKSVVGSVLKDYERFYYHGDLTTPEGFYKFSEIYRIQKENYGVVSDYTKKFLDPEIEIGLGKINIDSVVCCCDVDVRFVQAGPGCGKTTTAINQCKIDRDVCDACIVLPTTNARDDVIQRLIKKTGRSEEELKRFVRTFASVILNQDKNPVVSELWIDECLMMHAGQVVAIIALIQPSVVYCIGDQKQIPFVNRNPDFGTLRYSDIKIISRVDESMVLSVTRRVPIDVTTVLNELYLDNGSGLKSTNENGLYEPTVSVVNISSVAEVPIIQDKDTFFLTFKQADKDSLKEKGIKNVSTVHEFQGLEAKNIVVVRLDPYPQTQIYLKINYVVVAISRHTKNLKYYTVRNDDALSKMINQIRTKTFEDKKQCFVRGGSDKKYYTTQESSLFQVSNSMIKSRSKGVIRVNTNRQWKKNFEYNLDIKTSDKVKLELQLSKIDKNFSKMYVNDGFLEYFSANLFHVILLKYFGGEGRQFVIVTQNEFVTNEVFEVLNVNAVSDSAIDNEDDPELVIDTEVQENLSDVVLEPSSTVVHEGGVELLQNYHDRFFRNDYESMFYNIDMIRSNTLLIQGEPMRVDYSAFVPKDQLYDCMTPILKTLCPMRKERDFYELLLSLSKRNFSVPQNQGDVNERMLVEKMFSRFKYCYLDDDKLEKMDLSTIQYDSKKLIEWVNDQQSHVYTKITSENDIASTALNEYEVDIKLNPKIVVSRELGETYAASQTIVYHKKNINAIFCPILKEIRRRIMSVLKHNVFIYTDQSIESFEQKVSRIFDLENLVSCDQSVELDISKYDKSQMLIMILLERKILLYFGVNEQLVELWVNAHLETTLVNRQFNFKTWLCFQRKSGDAFTFFGNTLFLMCVIAYCLPVENCSLLLFAGDDSYLRGRKLVPRSGWDAERIALLFNLEVKFFDFDYPYFCSKFIIPFNGGVVFIPDPLKILVKLGRSDLRNEEHVEEYRISLLDSVRNFTRVELLAVVNQALNERYLTIDVDYLPLLHTIYSFASDADYFQELFCKPNDMREYHGDLYKVD